MPYTAIGAYIQIFELSNIATKNWVEYSDTKSAIIEYSTYKSRAKGDFSFISGVCKMLTPRTQERILKMQPSF